MAESLARGVHFMAEGRKAICSEVVKALTDIGYTATDTTKQVLIDGLDSVDRLTGGAIVKVVRDASKSAVYQMNAAVARQVLDSLKPR